MQKLRKFITPILIATPLVWLLAQCSIGNPLPIVIGKKIWLHRDSNVLKNEVRHIIPVGSSITSAKWLLEFNGFQCRYGKKSEPETRWEIERTSKDGDHLSCERTQSYLVCALTHATTVRYIKDEVTSVYASTGGYCL